MTKKNIVLFVLLLALGAFSLYLNRGRFASHPIQVSSRSMPPRGTLPRWANKSTANPVVFLLDRRLRLTSVRVIAAADTNAHPNALWALTSESNSVPVKTFQYGGNLQGMHPAVKGAVPELLEPGVTYRIFITAGSDEAQHDFVPTRRAPGH